MFIYKKENFLIQENIKQAREYLINRVDSVDTVDKKMLEDKWFNELTKSLERLPNLIYTFTRMVFQDVEDSDTQNLLNEALRIIQWMKDNRNITNQLPKNITEYRELEELADDIVQLEQTRESDKFIKSLYSSMRNRIKNLPKEELTELRSLGKEFMSLSPGAKSKFTPIKYFEKNNISIIDFMESLKRFLRGQDINEEKKRVFKYVKEHSDVIDVTYNDNNVLVLQTNDRESICELGSQKWCIVYSPSHYQSVYITEFNTQYIIFNFNLPSSSDNSMYGVTIKPNGELEGYGTSQNKANDGILLSDIYQKLGIPVGTLKSKWEKEYLNDKNRISEIEKILGDTMDISSIKELFTELDNIGSRFITIDYDEIVISWVRKNGNSTIDIGKLIEFIAEFYPTHTRRENSIYHVLKKETMDKIILYISKDYNRLLSIVSKNYRIFSLFGNFLSINSMVSEVLSKNESLSGDNDSIGGVSNFIKMLIIDTIATMSLYGYKSNLVNIDESTYIKFSTIDEIIEAYGDIDSIIKKITDYDDSIDGSHIKSNIIIEKEIIYVVETLLEDTEDFSKFSEFIGVYNRVKHIIDEDDEIVKKMLPYYIMKFTSLTDGVDELNEIEKYLIESDFPIESLLSDDNININDSNNHLLNNDYLSFVGSLLKDVNLNQLEEWVKNSSIVKYAIYLSDTSNIDKREDFYTEIGMVKYNDTWCFKTSYEDLGHLYEDGFDFEDYGIWGSYYDGTAYQNMIEEIDIDNLITLSVYFKDSGFNIDISILDKYIRNKYSYKESMVLYREDKDLNILLNIISDIIHENYEEDSENDIDVDIDIEEIQIIFNNVYSSVYQDISNDEYWNDTVLNLEIILDRWNGEGYGDNLLNQDDKGNIMIIPDLNVLLETDVLLITIDEFTGSFNDFTIGDLLDGYVSYHGKLDKGSDNGYVSWNDSNYVYFNERLSDELSMEQIDGITLEEWEKRKDIIMTKKKNISESIIRFNDFKINEKSIEELGHPDIFKSQFNDDERAIEDLEYYTNIIDGLQKDGGTVFRLVFLENVEDLDTSNLGQHWCVQFDQLSNFYNGLNSVMSDEMLPYCIIGHLKPGQINEDLSYGSYEELPNELEVNLNSDPEKYEVKIYRDTVDADRSWSKKI